MKKILLNIKVFTICLLAVCIAGCCGVAVFIENGDAFSPDGSEDTVRTLRNENSSYALPVPDKEKLSDTHTAENIKKTSVKENGTPAKNTAKKSADTAAKTSDQNDTGLVIDNFRFPFGVTSELGVNNTVTDFLLFEGDSRAYSVTLNNRGMLRLCFEFGVSESSGTPWMVYLYEEYSANGTDKNDSYRMITKFSVSASATDMVTSEAIGLYPGNYIAIVTTGTSVSSAKYSLSSEFKEAVAWEAEPNNTRSRYSDLSLNVKTGGSSAGTDGGDTDWYMISLPEQGIVDVLFEHSDGDLPQVGWIITLLDEDGNTIYCSRSFYKDTSLTSGEIGLKKGVYYIRVDSHIRSAADYYLTCNYEAIDTYETETNDTPETADSIAVNSEGGGISGSLCDKNTVPDIDYYCFNLESPGAVSFRFIHQDYLRDRDGWDIKLVDEKGNVYFRTVSRWKDMVTASPQIGLEAGKYYIVVDSENMLMNNGTYVLGLSYAPSDEWESETNNTIESADKIGLNKTVYGTLTEQNNDYDTDFFVLELDKKASVRFLFEHEGLSGDYIGWEINIYNEKGEKINYIDSKWSEASVRSDIMTLSTGRYYICVETGERFNTGKYSLTVQSS